MAIRSVRTTPTSTPRTTPHVPKNSRPSTVAARALMPQTAPQSRLQPRVTIAPRTAAQIAKSRAPKKEISTVAALTTPTLAKKTLTKEPSLIGRITKPKNLLLIGAASGAIAAKAAFISLAMKIGPTAAGHVFAQEIMLFLAPGATALAFGLELALKTATSLFVHGALPIILPILSTVVVTTLVVGLATYLAYLLLQAMKNRIYAFGERVGAELDKTYIGSAVKATALAIARAFSFKAEVEADGDASDDEDDVDPMLKVDTCMQTIFGVSETESVALLVAAQPMTVIMPASSVDQDVKAISDRVKKEKLVAPAAAPERKTSPIELSPAASPRLTTLKGTSKPQGFGSTAKMRKI